jgi:hypothetical protein
MKYPRYVYKRLNGQEYYCGVGDVWLENLKDKKKNSAADTAEQVKKYLVVLLYQIMGRNGRWENDGKRSKDLPPVIWD